MTKTKKKFRVGSRVKFIRGKEDRNAIHKVDGTMSSDIPRVRIEDRNAWYPEDYFKKASQP